MDTDDATDLVVEASRDGTSTVRFGDEKLAFGADSDVADDETVPEEWETTAGNGWTEVRVGEDVDAPNVVFLSSDASETGSPGDHRTPPTEAPDLPSTADVVVADRLTPSAAERLLRASGQVHFRAPEFDLDVGSGPLPPSRNVEAASRGTGDPTATPVDGAVEMRVDPDGEYEVLTEGSREPLLVETESASDPDGELTTFKRHTPNKRPQYSQLVDAVESADGSTEDETKATEADKSGPVESEGSEPEL